jgi:hypothetical protein
VPSEGAVDLEPREQAPVEEVYRDSRGPHQADIVPPEPPAGSWLPRGRRLVKDTMPEMVPYEEAQAVRGDDPDTWGRRERRLGKALECYLRWQRFLLVLNVCLFFLLAWAFVALAAWF